MIDLHLITLRDTSIIQSVTEFFVLRFNRKFNYCILSLL